MLAIIAERDKQYAQRFELQDKAVNAALTAAKEAVAAALIAAKEAVVKAEVASEKRFDSVNEFRNTLKDQQTTFPSRSEVDIKLKALDDKLTLLSSLMSQSRGQSEGKDWLWSVLVAVAGLLFGLGMMVMKFRESRNVDVKR